MSWLAAASVDPAVFALRPDYRALLIRADGLRPGPGDERSDALLVHAERSAQQRLVDHRPEDLEHVAAWREAYRAFGAKPQRTRCSVEALLRRVDAGLPRIDRITDTYNAVSVAQVVPLGGEDADHYRGSPRLVVATGEEEFDTMAGGESVSERPEPGEVVWRDDAGVTCRRWNWRQSYRTRLTTETTRAVFILDALDPFGEIGLAAAGAELIAHLRAFSPGLRTEQRLLAPGSAGASGA